jgi:hypothetical protein
MRQARDGMSSELRCSSSGRDCGGLLCVDRGLGSGGRSQGNPVCEPCRGSSEYATALDADTLRDLESAFVPGGEFNTFRLDAGAEALSA